jgi:UDP:flavonoid glycosyltransferase YjiC (YdhE family)
MHVLLVPIGSAGDVHPLIGLGAALPARGHAVTAVVSEQFEPLARQIGFETVRFGTTAEFESLSGDPDIWNPRKGVELIARMVVDRTPELCRIVRDRARARETVIVAGALAFGARIAQEIDGVPLVTVQLQPVCFRSEFESPILLPWLGDLADWPRPLKRLLFRLANVAMDRIVGPSLNRFRGSLGLAPASQFYDVWWNSPEAIVGFFPEWFARPQPDWPRQLVCAGFPRSDESAVREMPAAVEDFLTAGPPPVVFTPGSAMRHGASFFDASVSACERLGYRGLLLTPFTAQVPARLPAQVLHADYVPLGQLLPRCRALAHHGGIGTLAQGLAAGVPQLVMPMAYDQPDNAARLRRLGVGRSLRPAGYRGPAVAEALAELTTDAQVAAACARAAELIRAERPLDVACDVVERLARSHCSATATPSPAPAQDPA